MADKNKKLLYEVQSQTAYLTLEQLDKALGEHMKAIESFAYILHDKDTYTKEEEQQDSAHKEGQPKEPHFHCMIKLCESRRRSDVASWFGLPERHIQDSKSRNYGKMLLYLIHENAPEKHQYKESEVVANFSYSEYLAEVRKGERKKAADVRIREITNAIATGAIRKYNIHEFVSVEEYDKYRSHINNAFDYRATMLEQQNTRNMEVIYIYGDGGLGKSTYAETIAKRKGMSYKRSASERDPLAPYKGQDCFILEDVRGDTFKFQDWLAILDNFQDRAGSSRFHDRSFTECKMLFLTTTMPPEKFWKELSKNRPSEDPHQFYRRIKTVIHMTSTEILCKRYNEATHEFGREHRLENETLNKFSVHEETEAEQKERLADSLGIDKSTFEIATEQPKGIEPIPKDESRPPSLRLLDDGGRFYFIAENASTELKEQIKQFANSLSLSM